MRSTRVYTPLPLQSDSRVELDRRAAHYAVQVLRLRTGDALTLFNGDGNDYSARIIQSGRQSLIVDTGPATGPEALPGLRLHLVLGISRGERMDLAIQKSVELGVASITPVFCGRSVVVLSGERLRKRIAHWQGVVISACEQSGRRHIPELATATPVDTWLGQETRRGVTLDPAATGGLDGLPAPRGDVHLLVGPEGGLDGDERRHAIDRGLVPVRLGPRIMRTETAPIAALAAMQMLWGDFRSDR